MLFSSQRSALCLLGTLALSACNISIRVDDNDPPAPTPEKTYVVSGTLVRADGSVGAGDKVVVLKVDNFQASMKHLLVDYPVLADFISDFSASKYEATADAAGKFSFSLTAAQVTKTGATTFADLLVHYTSATSTDLATTSDWFNFTATTSEIAVGSVKLWDGGTGTVSASGELVNFDVATGAPAGNTVDTTVPYAMLAYGTDNTQTPPLFLEWGTYDVTTVLPVPRAAFRSTTAAKFLLFSTSKNDGKTYRHRTSMKTVSGSWVDLMRSSYASTMTFVDAAGAAVTAPTAKDGLMEPSFTFASNQISFLVDLGSPPAPISEVLIYNLVLTPDLTSTSITLEASATNTATIPAAFEIPLAVYGPGTSAYPNWAYIAWNGSETVRWIRVRVSTTDGVPHYLKSVAEIEVLTL
jgi:hypothetical protein